MRPSHLDRSWSRACVIFLAAGYQAAANLVAPSAKKQTNTEALKVGP